MTPTQEDHEAAARLHMSIASAAHAYYADHGEPCQGCIFIAAALSEAVRVALAHERRFLISCPWCGKEMKGAAISSQITHLIDCGDKRRARTDAQATPAPERKRRKVQPMGDCCDPTIDDE